MRACRSDPLCPHPANVLSVRPEAPGVATFSLEFQDRERQSRYQVQPGQFNMIYVPGVGEVPISVSRGPDEGPGIGHTIRFIGRVTDVIGKLGPGAVVGLRGPYGRGWPIEQVRGRDVVLVTGGLAWPPCGPWCGPCWPTAASTAASFFSTAHASRPISSTSRSIPSGNARGWRS